MIATYIFLFVLTAIVLYSRGSALVKAVREGRRSRIKAEVFILILVLIVIIGVMIII